MRGPDFLVIGAMKCATSTLHEQLARQPGVFMTTPKEPNFFSDDTQWVRGATWYESLFANAPEGALRGESSTHYTKLPTYPKTIRRMREVLGDRVKVIYVMRDPIERLVSQYIHEWTQRVIDVSIDRAIDDYPELIAYSQYAMQLRPFLGAFGPERVLPVFFERLATSPQVELSRIGDFIGAREMLRWNESLTEQNASTERMRKSRWRDAIIELPGARFARRTFVPKSIRNGIKRLWTMRQRPMLSSKNLQRLRTVFDRDLELLGGWLGQPLSCDSFKSITAQIKPDWAERSLVAAR